MNKMYDAQGDVELARTQSDSSFESLCRTLSESICRAQQARREFDKHVNEHGCRLSRSALGLPSIPIGSFAGATLV